MLPCIMRIQPGYLWSLSANISLSRTKRSYLFVNASSVALIRNSLLSLLYSTGRTGFTKSTNRSPTRTVKVRTSWVSLVTWLYLIRSMIFAYALKNRLSLSLLPWQRSSMPECYAPMTNTQWFLLRTARSSKRSMCAAMSGFVAGEQKIFSNENSQG